MDKENFWLSFIERKQIYTHVNTYTREKEYWSIRGISSFCLSNGSILYVIEFHMRSDYFGKSVKPSEDTYLQVYIRQSLSLLNVRVSCFTNIEGGCTTCYETDKINISPTRHVITHHICLITGTQRKHPRVRLEIYVFQNNEYI